MEAETGLSTPAESRAVSFFHDDFSFEDVKRCTAQLSLPIAHDSRGATDVDDDKQQWDSFFHFHSRGSFFKSRRYICTEFASYFEGDCSIVEFGCGYGCTLIPILKAFPNMIYVATDFSQNALAILNQHVTNILPPEVTVRSLRTQVLDVARTAFTADSLPSRALAIFALSAIDNSLHTVALRNIFESLQPGGYFLFRDYAIHDMTMYRHKTRFNENLFQRSDGTLAYYFDIEYVKDLFISVGFVQVELRYDCVKCRNKKSEIDMRRVFVHAVFHKPLE